MLLKPLARDYWPDSVSSPYPRLALALVTAPLAIAFSLGAFTFAIYMMAPNPTGALAEATEVALAFLEAFYPLTAAAAAPAVALLWSLRMRSRRAFLLSGFGVGGIGALIRALSTGMTVTSEALTFVLFGAALMLAIRQIAGIRH